MHKDILQGLKLCIQDAWSKETCHPSYRDKWTKRKKCVGQCAVTAMVIHDVLNYDIYDVMVGNQKHFFNKDEDGNVVDLTAAQFDGKTIHYENGRLRKKTDLLKTADVKERYLLLKGIVMSNIFVPAKWIDEDEDNGYYSNCSNCGMQIDVHHNRGYHSFCPNCGKIML